MLVAGIGCLLAGLVAIGFGIPINEFGLGNTLILAGAVTACTGLLILCMWIAVKELKGSAGQLGAAPALDLKRSSSQSVALPRPVGAESGDTAPYADPAGGLPDGPPPMPPPWSEEAGARGPRQDAPPVPTSESAAKPRRNLMFSSSSRKERDRAQARAGEVSVAEPPPAPAVPAAEVSAPPPANFDDAWPKSERVRSAAAPPRRVARNPSAISEPGAARQAPPVETQPQVTVLKSGVVDGMAYSLYSDGSIEAQMPEGMMRFASIDELRAHLDQRP
jgi:hypothetical protein